MDTKESRSQDPLTSNQATSFGSLLVLSYKFQHRLYRALPRNHYPPTSTPFMIAYPWPTAISFGSIPPPAPNIPCSKLLERLGFPRRLDQLPVHIRDIAIDLDGSGTSPPLIEDLGHVLCDIYDFFSTSKPVLARVASYSLRFPPSWTAHPCYPAPAASTLSAPSRKMLHSINFCSQASFST